MTAAEPHVSWLAEVQAHTLERPLTPLWPPGVTLTTARWEAYRADLQRLWLDLLGPMPERPSSAAFAVLRTDELPDVTRQLIEYEGEPGLRVQAYLLRPNGPQSPRSRAGIVALHGTTPRTIEPIAGVEGPADRHTGLLLAQRGFVVICPRCFLWQDTPSYTAAVDAHRQRHPHTLGMHKMLYDAQRAVDILAAQPDVDPERLGACGHSLGAKETLYLTAFDERIRAAVASEGGLELTSTNWDAPWYLGPICRTPDFARDHHELVALIAPRPLLVLGGETGPGAADGERSWPYLSAAVPIYHLTADPAPVGLLNHREGHRLSPASTEKLVEWLSVYLDGETRARR